MDAAPSPRRPPSTGSRNTSSGAGSRRPGSNGTRLTTKNNHHHVNHSTRELLDDVNLAKYHISERDLKIAFDFLDHDGLGVITLQGMKKTLAAFYGGPEYVPMSELKFLMEKKKELTLKDLVRILEETDEVAEHCKVDPIKQAFQIYDPENKGFIEPNALGRVLERLGHGSISEEDMRVLVETIDEDGDGKIGLADFRHMLTMEDTKFRNNNIF